MRRTPFRVPSRSSRAVLCVALAAALAAVGCSDAPTEQRVAPDEEAGETLPFLSFSPVCTEGLLLHGAAFRICRPRLYWNRGLIVVPPTYGDPHREPEIREGHVEGRRLSEIVTGLGYAYATTSHRKNGLVLPEAVEDLEELVETARAWLPRPLRHVFAVGASHGSLTAVQTLEQSPGTFGGGLAMCGPIGDFQAQMNHVGDLRVIFDVLLGDAVDTVLEPTSSSWPAWTAAAPRIPVVVVENWDLAMSPAIQAALAGDPLAVQQLLAVTDVPVDPANPEVTAGEGILGLLWYHVFGTNDALGVLGGQPFDNEDRLYQGSLDDAAINQVVERFAADPAAVDAMNAHFETSGVLAAPLVTLHTTGDAIVPVLHQGAYGRKAAAAGSAALNRNLTIRRHGHCNFRVVEVLAAFGLLVRMTQGPPLVVHGDLVPEASERARLVQLLEAEGAPPPLLAEGGRLPVDRLPW